MAERNVCSQVLSDVLRCGVPGSDCKMVPSCLLAASCGEKKRARLSSICSVAMHPCDVHEDALVTCVQWALNVESKQRSTSPGAAGTTNTGSVSGTVARRDTHKTGYIAHTGSTKKPMVYFLQYT